MLRTPQPMSARAMLQPSVPEPTSRQRVSAMRSSCSEGISRHFMSLRLRVVWDSAMARGSMVALRSTKRGRRRPPVSRSHPMALGIFSRDTSSTGRTMSTTKLDGRVALFCWRKSSREIRFPRSSAAFSMARSMRKFLAVQPAVFSLPLASATATKEESVQLTSAGKCSSHAERGPTEMSSVSLLLTRKNGGRPSPSLPSASPQL
mmetsp:Transcript_8260/g.34692  ORF Transcript_8260/g.34692 Transcript_8260/m.34692 type:complete len:205 (-) Transcript_8260:578-1192(-)